MDAASLSTAVELLKVVVAVEKKFRLQGRVVLRFRDESVNLMPKASTSIETAMKWRHEMGIAVAHFSP